MRWIDLGRKGYQETWDLQEKLRKDRIEGKIENTILFVEHSPVITVGKQKDAMNDFRKDPASIVQGGIEVIHSNRGGRLTYHGPGQLVVYFIFDLKSLHLSIKQLVCRLEKSCLVFLDRYGLVGKLKEGTPGVWLEGGKVAFIGMHVSRGVTQHGLSINVAENSHPWEMIVPCGLKETPIISIERVLGYAPSMEEVKKIFLDVLTSQEISLISEKVGAAEGALDFPSEDFIGCSSVQITSSIFSNSSRRVFR